MRTLVRMLVIMLLCVTSFICVSRSSAQQSEPGGSPKIGGGVEKGFQPRPNPNPIPLPIPKETPTEWGTITWLEVGWTEDSMTIQHSSPNFVNPNGCPVAGSYATDPKDPGHSLFHTVALSAFMNKKQVSLLIHGCVYGKPKIIAVGVRP